MDHESEQASLVEFFFGVSWRVRRVSKGALATLGISPSQSRALWIIAHRDAVRPGVLSEHLRIAPRSATEVVDGLEERGLVERSADPADRRATLVSLTPAGRSLLDEVHEARAAEAEALFGSLSDWERTTLRRILGKLNVERAERPEH